MPERHPSVGRRILRTTWKTLCLRTYKVLNVGFVSFAFLLLASMAIGAFSGLFSEKAGAQANTTISYQARLLLASGALVPDGNYHIQFKIYNAATPDGGETPDQGACTVNGGTPDEDCLWIENRTTGNLVRVVNGYVSVNLGSVTAFPSTMPWGDNLYITMRVGGTSGPSWDTEMVNGTTGRMKMNAVPYAFNASNLSTSATNSASTNSSNITVQTGNATGATSNSGNISIDVGTATGTAGTISLGSANASALNIGRSGLTTTNVGNLLIQGGTTTLGTNTQAGSLVLYDGSSNTGTLQVAALGSNEVYILPDSDGSDTICLQDLANCAGAGDIVQNGNSFGVAITIGSNDAYDLNFETNGTTRITVDDTTGDVNFTGNIVVASSKSITITGGNTASRPGSPTEGMVYFDSDTDSLLTYANGKWQSDRGEYVVVAANDSSQAEKDSADYVADGTADQTEINNALTVAAGGKVILLAGTYVANGTILIPNNTTLAGTGPGTVIELADIDATDNLIENSDTITGTGVVIRDLKLDGRDDLNTAGVQKAVYFSGMGSGTTREGSQIRNVIVEDFATGFSAGAVHFYNSDNNTILASTFNSNANGVMFGVQGDAGSVSDRNIVTGSKLTNNTFIGIYNAEGSYNTFSNNIFDTNDYGVYFEDGDYNNVRGNTLTNNTSNGVYFDGVGADYIRIENNDISYNSVGLQLYGGIGHVITGNTVSFNSADGISASIDGRSEISNNTVSDNTGYGIYLNIGNAYSITTGNTISNNGDTTDNKGIYVRGDFNSVTNNIITDTSCDTTCYAIDIDADADETYLEGNRYSDTDADSGDDATINDAGTGTIYAGQSLGVTTGTSVSNFTFRGTNSTTAFSVQNASGSSILTVDTTNGEVELGNATTAGKLVVSDGSSNTVTLLANATAGDYTLTIPTLTANDTICVLTANNCSILTSSLTDNIANSFDLQEGTNNYININTTNGSENISFGNATTNPSYNFLGTGSLAVAGNVDFAGTLAVGTSNAFSVAATGVTTINYADYGTPTNTPGLIITSDGEPEIRLTPGGGAAIWTISADNGAAGLRLYSGSTVALQIDSGYKTTIYRDLTVGTTVDDDITFVGSIAGANPLIFDGATDNNFEITLAVTDPGADYTITLPDTTGTVSLATSGSATTGISGFVQGGNTWGANNILGTNDSFSLIFETNNITALTIDTSQNVTLAGTLAVNGDSITADGATLTINAAGAVDIQDNVTVDSLTVDTGNVTVDTNTLFVDASNNLVSVGSTSDLGGRFQIVGGADETQLLVRANGTQSLSNPLVLLQNSSAAELARINASTTSLYFGNAAGGSNASGANNTAIGASALGAVSTGAANTTLGSGALASITGGSNSVAVGYNAGNLATGGNNIFIGYQAGDNVVGGTNNIIIGYDLNASAAGVNNELRIGGVLQGDTSTLAAQFNGDLAVVGNTTLTGDLAVNGDDITGDGVLTVNAASYVRIGDSGTPGVASGDDDLYVEGDLETDGVINIGGIATLLSLGAADNNTQLCRNSSNQIATCDGTGSGAAFLNGGNAFSLASTLGNTSNVDLSVITNNTTRFTVQADGDIAFDTSTLFIDAANNTVNVSSQIFNAVTNASCGVSCTVTQSNIDNYSTITVNATAAALDITVPDPTLTTAGRTVYVTAANGSEDFTLVLNSGGTLIEIAMRENVTATLVWNGSDWTAAGASSSTTLQAAYSNTLTSAGGAEIVLNAPGGNADGLTIRNNDITPITGGLLEVQTSIGSNLLTVNNNATEYATNGGAETAGASSSTFPSNTWDTTTGGTVDRYTTVGDNVATGQASVRVQTTASNEGARNRISTSLTSGLSYTVSFAVRGASNFSTLEVRYSPDGTTSGTTLCGSATNTVTSGIWTRITCSFVASGTITSSNSMLIRQTDGTARTFYVDNLSINVNASATYAADGSVDSALGSNWTAFGTLDSLTRDTTTIYDTSGSVAVNTPNNADRGVRNNLAITPATNTQYLVTFYARSSNTFNDIRVRYSRDGGTDFETCVDYNTQTVSTTAFTEITCLFTTDGTTATDPDLIIDQPTASDRTFHIDALSVTLNTNNSNNVQVGGANKGGPVTLFTLDRSSGAPIAANNDAYLGSMYYDTSTGRIQCYEADGWGACGAAPDNIVNLNPEYAGAVLNGTGVGTMTADFCSDDTALTVNASLCETGQAKNYYRWTSPQATQQTYSIYVTYQLPATFNGFASDDTVQLVARVDSTTNASVTYEMYKSTGSAVTQCGTGETNIITGGGGSADTWYSYGINGNEATGCSLNSSSAGNFIIFKINLKANSNANAYVSTLSFTTTGR